MFGFLALLHRSPAVHLFLRFLPRLLIPLFVNCGFCFRNFLCLECGDRFVHKITEHLQRMEPFLGNVIFMIFVLSLLSALSHGLVSFAVVCTHSFAPFLVVVIATDFSVLGLHMTFHIWVLRRLPEMNSLRSFVICTVLQSPHAFPTFGHSPTFRRILCFPDRCNKFDSAFAPCRASVIIQSIFVSPLAEISVTWLSRFLARCA